MLQETINLRYGGRFYAPRRRVRQLHVPYGRFLQKTFGHCPVAGSPKDGQTTIYGTLANIPPPLNFRKYAHVIERKTGRPSGAKKLQDGLDMIAARRSCGLPDIRTSQELPEKLSYGDCRRICPAALSRPCHEHLFPLINRPLRLLKRDRLRFRFKPSGTRGFCPRILPFNLPRFTPPRKIFNHSYYS